MGMRSLARAALPPHARDEATVDACYALALTAYMKAPAALSVPYPGIRELLVELRRRGVSRAVLSNKSDPVVRLVVDALLPGHGFSVLRGARPNEPLKPDPSIALEIASALGAEPRTVLYLGDSGIDMKTAKAAGFFAVGAAWASETGQSLFGTAPTPLLSIPSTCSPSSSRSPSSV